VPPEAVRFVAGYITPTTPFGKEDVMTARAEGLIAMLRFVVAVAFRESFTCAVNGKVHDWLGVPVICPVAEFSVRPVGSEPAAIDQL